MGAAEKFSSQQLTQHIVDKLDELPTLPTIVYELSRVINDPMSSTGDIEKTMANDQSLTTKVLRLANSAYYAIPGGVSNLQRAIAYIGYDAIHQLVLSASIIKALDAKGSAHFDLNQFWKHSVGAAMAAETVARHVGYKVPADLFTCGLVHDMGKVAIYIIAPEVFAESLQAAKERGVSLLEAEMALENPRHTYIGAQLAVKWRLPAQIQATIGHHHQKDASLRGGLSQEMNLVVDIVYLSNLLMHALQFGNSGHAKVLGVPKEVLERMHLTPEKLKELIAKIKEAVASADGFLKIIGG
jgi:putative nucleotidyltransferase with HDIG domain